MKFMLIDDNVNMRTAIRKILKRHVKNIKHIYECNDGSEAVEIYQKFHPDWVLMDLKLIKMDGLTATKMIKEKDPNAKIIIVTQYDDPAYREAARDAGACNYILKDNLLALLNIIHQNSTNKAINT